MSASLKPRAHGGFTLVEMLVVMSLLAVIMVAMASSLRTVAQVEDRVDGRLSRADEIRTSVGFLQSTLGRVSLRKLDPVSAAGFPYLFQARPQEVSWVGVMPARFGAGGRYFFHLAVEDIGSGPALVLRFVPWSPVERFPDWATADSRVLVNGVTSVAFKYFNTRPTAGAWTPIWDVNDALPDRVSVALTSSNGVEWPELIVPMRGVAVGGSVAGGGVVFGGGAGEFE